MEKHHPHLLKIIQMLNQHVINSGAKMEGNLFYHHHQDLSKNQSIYPPFKKKREQLLEVVKDKKHVLEIGFNAGHSAALMMINNPNMRYSAIDICMHPYTKPCADALSQLFGVRFKFYEGDSARAYPNNYRSFEDCDLVHIDGGHSLEMFRIDTLNAICLPRDTTVERHLLIDDVDLPEVREELNRFVAEGFLEIVDQPGFDKNHHILCRILKRENTVKPVVEIAEAKKIDEPVTFVCVWTGNGAPYNEQWVQKLQSGIKRHYKGEHRFVCMTDRDHIEGVETIKLEHNWPVYWSKIELFKPGTFSGPMVYMDLDVMITGDIEPFVKEWESMVMLTDYYPEIANSTLLYWNADDEFYHGIYNNMLANSKKVMHDHRNRWPITHNYGDQEYIADYLTSHGKKILRWQDILPKEWFIEFSYTSVLNPVVRDQKFSPDLRFCYCLGSPKFQQYPNMHIVKNNWL